jgi:hypothetical protein
MTHKLKKYTLSHSLETQSWVLIADGSKDIIRSFEKKEQATKGGVLKAIIGDDGGSVKIKLKNNIYQEERTYPKSSDPIESEG